MRQVGLALLAVSLAACSAGEPVATAQEAPASKAEVTYVSPDELKALMDAGKVILVDVRTPEEFGEARLHGSLNAPLQTFDPATIPIEAGRETILYCRSSGRSGRAATMLAEYLGRRVRHMEGGIIAWQDAGLATIN